MIELNLTRIIATAKRTMANPAAARARRLAAIFFKHTMVTSFGTVPPEGGLTTTLFLTRSSRAYTLRGSIFKHHRMPARKQRDMATRLIALAADAVAIATVEGSWDESSASVCGDEMRYQRKCSSCGAWVPWAREKPYHHWYVSCEVRLWNSDNAWYWDAHVLHDHHWRITDWEVDYMGKSCGVWSITPLESPPWFPEPWMHSHLTPNYPLVRRFLKSGSRPYPGSPLRRIAVPITPGRTLLAVHPVKLRKALRTINISALRVE